MIQFSEQLFSNFSDAGAHGRLVVSADLAQIRVWGPRVLSILESGETRYWRDQSLGALFSGVVTALGYFLLDWSLGMLILFWTCDLLAVWLGDVLKSTLAPRQLEDGASRRGTQLSNNATAQHAATQSNASWRSPTKNCT